MITQLEIGQQFSTRDGRTTKVLGLQSYYGEGTKRTGATQTASTTTGHYYANGPLIGRWCAFGQRIGSPMNFDADLVLPVLESSHQQLSLFD